MYYELATLYGPLLKLRDMEMAAQQWVAQGNTGPALGWWRTDIGPLGRVIVLRGFPTAEALAGERERALLSRNPFHANGIIDRLEMESYRPFPFLPPVQPRRFGGIYEFRTYHLKPSGLPPTLEAWRAAIGPARDYTDHLVINLFAIDGAPRITHIWGFESIQQRVDLRQRHYAAGLWPPKGGPEQIDHAVSTIALAGEGSPLC